MPFDSPSVTTDQLPALHIPEGDPLHDPGSMVRGLSVSVTPR